MAKDIYIKDLSIYFGNDINNKVVDNVSVNFKSNCITGIIGESGSGKSVMGMSILQLLSPNANVSGEIIYDNKNLLRLKEDEINKIRGNVISLIPQNPSESLNSVLNIYIQIAEIFRKNKNKEPKSEEKSKINELLRNFGFKEPENINKSYPFELSGGMKQRIVSIFGVAGSPSWIIADEPTKGLDATLRNQVYELLLKIKEEKSNSMMVITHDISLAYNLCDRIMVMYKGKVVEEGEAKDLVDNPIHPYTKALVNCIPSKGMKEIKQEERQFFDIGYKVFEKDLREKKLKIIDGMLSLSKNRKVKYSIIK